MERVRTDTYRHLQSDCHITTNTQQLHQHAHVQRPKNKPKPNRELMENGEPITEGVTSGWVPAGPAGHVTNTPQPSSRVGRRGDGGCMLMETVRALTPVSGALCSGHQPPMFSPSIWAVLSDGLRPSWNWACPSNSKSSCKQNTQVLTGGRRNRAASLHLLRWPKSFHYKKVNKLPASLKVQ